MKKPANILYGLNDKIPFFVAVPLVLQQLVVLSMDLVLPALLISMAGGTRETAQNFVSLMMIGIGLGTLLQVWPRKRIGSGYFCAEETGFLYYQASALAVQSGGLPLLFGMTAVAGVFQMLLSRVVRRIRFLFPAEVAGLMVAMTGIAGIAPGVSAIFGAVGANDSVSSASAWTGLSSLAIMISQNVWGTARMREYSILIGMVAGYVLSYSFGILDYAALTLLTDASYFAFPSWTPQWSFDRNLLLPFLIAAVCSTLKTIGNLSICQKTNVMDWKRIDLENVGKGLLAEGAGTTACGFIGCMGLNSSSSSVGLSMISGVTSRRMGYFVSGVFILMAFLPKAAALLAIMPAPVMGALLLVNLGYFIVEGFQMVTSRMLDNRKIFVIGMALVFGLSVDLVPGIYAQFPPALRPFFNSSLAVVSLTAIVLNLLFRLGIQQKSAMELPLREDSQELMTRFMEKQGAVWGARAEVVHRASSAMLEFLDTVTGLGLVKSGSIRLEASFDEYNLRVRVAYMGTMPEFPGQRPTEEELLQDERALAKLSGYLMRRYASEMTAVCAGEECVITFHFEH